MNKKQVKGIIQKNKPAIPPKIKALPKQRAGGIYSISAKLDRELRVGKLTTRDPGDGVPIYVENKGKAFCELTVGAGAETRPLPTPSTHAIGTELTVILRYADGGTATVTGSVDGPLELAGVGDLGVFVISVSDETKVWRTIFPFSGEAVEFPITIEQGGTGADNAADARDNLGLGTIAVQDADDVTITGGDITGITDLAIADGGTGASTAADARTNLGLGTIATQNANNVSITGGTITGITDLTVADGGTGASTASGARANLGISLPFTNNSGVTIPKFSPVMHEPGGAWMIADIDFFGETQVVGFVENEVLNNAQGVILLDGPLVGTQADWEAITEDGSPLTAGNSYYLSSMIGKIGAPANFVGLGNMSAPVGVAIDETTLVIDIVPGLRIEREINARRKLQKLRWAINKFLVENAAYPGSLTTTEAEFKADLAVYLREPFPTCPVGADLNNQVEVSSAAGALVPDGGVSKSWLYSDFTGEIIINSSNLSIIELDSTYDEI